MQFRANINNWEVSRSQIMERQLVVVVLGFRTIIRISKWWRWCRIPQALRPQAPTSTNKTPKIRHRCRVSRQPPIFYNLTSKLTRGSLGVTGEGMGHREGRVYLQEVQVPISRILCPYRQLLGLLISAATVPLHPLRSNKTP